MLNLLRKTFDHWFEAIIFSERLFCFFGQVREIFPDAIILRLSFFLENDLSQTTNVKGEGKMVGPGDPYVLAPYMAAADAGKAAAGNGKKIFCQRRPAVLDTKRRFVVQTQ